MIWFKRFITFIFCCFVALPIAWLIYAAFLPPKALLYADLTIIGFSFNNFIEASKTGIWRALAVSLSASSLVVCGQLFLGLMAAYAIRAGLRIFPLLLIALALPSELLMVPIYRELELLHILDSFWALVLPFLSSPLVIFLLVQSLRRLPWELVEAARIDGLGEFHIVWRILAPLLRPEMLAAGILSFAMHWNLVLFPKVMADEDYLRTVQVFLNDLLKSRPLDWGVLGAASLIATLPLLTLYIVFEKRIIEVFESNFK